MEQCTAPLQWEMRGAQAQASHGRARASVNSVMLTVVAKKHEQADELVSRVQVRITVLPARRRPHIALLQRLPRAL